MANARARSTTGVNTNDGSTWALANLDLAGANVDAPAAGDTIYLSQAHAETNAASLTVTFAGTPAAPSKVLCVNDSADTPAAAATGATITSVSTIVMAGSALFQGITFRPGSGASATQSFNSGSGAANTNQQYDNCSIQLLTTGTGVATMTFGDETRTDSARITLRNTTLKFGGVNHRVKVACAFKWEGGSFVSGSASPGSVFTSGVRGMGDFLVSNVDFSSNIGTAFNLFAQNVGGNSFVAKFRNILLPASWSGALWSATPTAPGIGVEVFDSAIGTAKLRYWTHYYSGQVRDETTIVRTGGSTDDGVVYSMKMVSTADAEYPTIPLEGAPITVFEDTTGSPVTRYVEVAHDSQGSGAGGALTNADMAAKIYGPGGFVTNIKADFIVAAADHATSSATWTTTGLVTPVKQKLAITYTPTRKGPWTITPVLFIASKTVYVCNKVS
jgi:hypothetical protein